MNWAALLIAKMHGVYNTINNSYQPMHPTYDIYTGGHRFGTSERYIKLESAPHVHFAINALARPVF